jgi:hypothetical protein
MPLVAGRSKSAHSANMKELVRAFKSSGKIGTSHPKSMKAAVAQANAIAYDKQRRSK